MITPQSDHSSLVVVKLAPLMLTAIVIIWTMIISRFTTYGDEWAAYPILVVFVITLILHVWFVVALQPKVPLVLYGVLHLLIQAAIFLYCIIIITKNAL